MRSDPPPLKGATQLRQAGPGPLLHVANSPSDLALVVVVEVIKEVLSCTLQVLQGWGKSLVDVSLHSNMTLRTFGGGASPTLRDFRGGPVGRDTLTFSENIYLPAKTCDF